MGEVTAEELVAKIAAVASAVGWQAGVCGTSLAGQIISCLAADPDLIPKFMAEGTEMFIDGSLATERGCLTYTALNGEIHTPEFLAAHKQVVKIKRAEGIS